MEHPKLLTFKSSALESKKPEEDLKNPEFWLSQINEAMIMLTFHGYRQKTSEGICVDPVYKAINQLGDAIKALQKLKHKVPNIDLSGLPEEFILSMEIHPATAEVAKWFEQMKQKERLKEHLVKKWGTKGERSQRLKSDSQPKTKLP